jgi:GH15 family glucan-1,4-alpha-glucosidase
VGSYVAADPAIADHALLSDGNGAALVDCWGTVDWWCLPRFDSPSVFARLLDPEAGHWTIRPTGGFTATRRYLPGTLVLVNEFRTPGGVVELTDALVLPRADPHRMGREVPHALARHVRAVDGEVELAVELVPRFDYGRDTAAARPAPGRSLRLDGPDDRLRLDLDGAAAAEPAPGGARGTLRLRAGDEAGYVLGPDHAAVPGADDRRRAAAAMIHDTVAVWQDWSEAHDRYDGAYSDEVRCAGLVLQGLTSQPHGSVVAAPTTSLPEVIGGDANWDYRYAWLRDAAIVLRALWVGACPDEAGRYVDWMARAAGEGGVDALQVLYRPDGGQHVPEVVLPHLAGYRGSRPVRVGNAAAHQRQLDIPGHVLDAAWAYRDHLTPDGGRTGRLVGALADWTSLYWRHPDSGIWEGREGERQYTSSKLLCWVALDRAVRLAPRVGVTTGLGQWAMERNRVRAWILDRGWHEGVGAFTGAPESDHLDASMLLTPLVGLLPPTDERVTATIRAIEAELTDGGLVRRWTGAEDGAFLMCSFWLAECHARAGRVDRARAVFEAAAGCANDLGLLSEMADPQTRELVGNFPLALSHAALVTAAYAIDRAEHDQRSQPDDILSDTQED